MTNQVLYSLEGKRAGGDMIIDLSSCCHPRSRMLNQKLHPLPVLSTPSMNLLTLSTPGHTATTSFIPTVMAVGV
jgi:hypothetical protein